MVVSHISYGILVMARHKDDWRHISYGILVMARHEAGQKLRLRADVVVSRLDVARVETELSPVFFLVTIVD